ncbi:hypothetical protein HX096_09325 [Empedobacter falsenii]|uniref:hypothetical protein n=1 Tax=Empedobacter falsenii TaxID=343874 RepID=UPI0025779515|nr:hypothetical protein [Empedobacter falsenii]MDM1548056.1 hypothetical protein [Empedobacter falsenii]
MKRKLTFFISVLSTSYAFSQVGVNTDNPMSTLDVSVKMNGSTIDNSQIYGLQAPRLTRAELISTSGTTSKYGANQKGAIVYITDVSGTDTGGSSTQRLNITTAGYYYFDGSVWVKITDSSTPTTSTEPWYDNQTKLPATTNVQNIYQKGYVGIGYFDATKGTSNETINRGSLTNAFTIAGTGANNDDMLIESVSTDASSGQLNFKKSRGTYAAKIDVVAEDKIGEIIFNGPSNSFGNLTVRSETPTTGYLMLGTSGTERMRITGTGNVGIGTNAPAQKLDVSGNIRANSLTNGGNPISGDFGIYNQNSNWLRIATQGSDNGASGASKIAFYTNATAASPIGVGTTPAMVVDGGKVGIGTASPSNKLQITSGTTDESGLTLSNIASANLLGTDNTGKVVKKQIIENGGGYPVAYDPSSGNVMYSKLWQWSGDQTVGSDYALTASNFYPVPNTWDGIYEIVVKRTNPCGYTGFAKVRLVGGNLNQTWNVYGLEASLGGGNNNNYTMSYGTANGANNNQLRMVFFTTTVTGCSNGEVSDGMNFGVGVDPTNGYVYIKNTSGTSGLANKTYYYSIKQIL